jgi:hypothetical protein
MGAYPQGREGSRAPALTKSELTILLRWEPVPGTDRPFTAMQQFRPVIGLLTPYRRRSPGCVFMTPEHPSLAGARCGPRRGWPDWRLSPAWIAHRTIPSHPGRGRGAIHLCAETAAGDKRERHDAKVLPALRPRFRCADRLHGLGRCTRQHRGKARALAAHDGDRMRSYRPCRRHSDLPVTL